MSSLTFVTALAAVSYMPVPDALCIVFSCPVVTILLSALVLRDRWGRVSRVTCHTDHVRDSLGPAKITAGLLLLGGVVLVCRPPFLFHYQSLIQVDSCQTCKRCLTRGWKFLPMGLKM